MEKLVFNFFSFGRVLFLSGMEIDPVRFFFLLWDIFNRMDNSFNGIQSLFLKWFWLKVLCNRNILQTSLGVSQTLFFKWIIFKRLTLVLCLTLNSCRKVFWECHWLNVYLSEKFLKRNNMPTNYFFSPQNIFCDILLQCSVTQCFTTKTYP